MRPPAGGLPAAWLLGGSQHALAARAGLMAPLGEAKDDYEVGFVLGPYYAGRLQALPGLGAIPFEAGLDVAWIRSSDGSVDAGLFMVRFDALFSGWSAMSDKVDWYGMAGCEVVLAEDARASAVNLGAGLTSAEQKWDARVTYSLLSGSGNIQGLLLLTGGQRF